jgi:hypothetical protein
LTKSMTKDFFELLRQIEDEQNAILKSSKWTVTYIHPPKE